MIKTMAAVAIYVYYCNTHQGSSYISQRNPEHFDNPLKFDPSRFEPGQKRYIYIVEIL